MLEVSACLWAPGKPDPFIVPLLDFSEDGMAVPLVEAPPALLGRVGFVSPDFRPILVWDFKVLDSDAAANHAEKKSII